jgi:hypothetical protein
VFREVLPGLGVLGPVDRLPAVRRLASAGHANKSVAARRRRSRKTEKGMECPVLITFDFASFAPFRGELDHPP